MDSKGLKHTYTCIHSPPDSPPLPHVTLSRIPCTVQQVLAGYPFEYSGTHVYPKLSNYASPSLAWAAVSSLSKSVSLPLLHESICIISLDPAYKGCQMVFLLQTGFLFLQTVLFWADLQLKHSAWYFVQLDKNMLAACQIHPEMLQAWSLTSCVILVTHRRFLSLMKSKQSSRAF